MRAQGQRIEREAAPLPCRRASPGSRVGTVDLGLDRPDGNGTAGLGRHDRGERHGLAGYGCRGRGGDGRRGALLLAFEGADVDVAVTLRGSPRWSVSGVAIGIDGQGVASGVDGRAAGQEGHGLGRAAVVLERAKQGIDRAARVPTMLPLTPLVRPPEPTPIRLLNATRDDRDELTSASSAAAAVVTRDDGVIKRECEWGVARGNVDAAARVVGDCAVGDPHRAGWSRPIWTNVDTAPREPPPEPRRASCP